MNLLRLSRSAIGKLRLTSSSLRTTRRFAYTDLKSLVSDDNSLSKEPLDTPILTGTDSFSIVAKVFHPSIMRAYKISKDIQSSDATFNDAQRLAEKVLRGLNRQLTKMSIERLRTICNLPAQIESNGFADVHFPTLLKKCDEQQLKALVAFMIINQSRSTRLWAELDTKFCQASIEDIDLQLLAAYGLINSKTQNGLSYNPRFPQQLLQKIIEEKIPLQSLPFTDDSGVFDSLNSMVVRDNLAVERLSLLLHLFSSQPSIYLSIRRSHSKTTQELSEYTLKVLTAIQNPVKLVTLKNVWENMVLLNLPNGYTLYRKLHQQISFSITTDGIQVSQHEDCVASLFASMVSSKFKSNALIDLIFGIVEAQGLNYDQNGVRLFNSLIQLESYPFAISVLRSIMDNTNTKIDYLFKQWKRDHALLSGDAKDYINTWLINEHKINGTAQIDEKGELIPSFRQSLVPKRSSADLIFGLFSFGRDAPNSNYGRTLKKVEASFLPKLQSMDVHELVSIIHSYGLVGRFQPDIINVFDEAIGKYINVWRQRAASEAAIANTRPVQTTHDANHNSNNNSESTMNTPTTNDTDGDKIVEVSTSKRIPGRGKKNGSNRSNSNNDSNKSSQLKSPYMQHRPNELSLFQIEIILWSYARLNHKSIHLPALKECYTTGFQSFSPLYRAGTVGVTRFLWSLAVLEQLDYQTYMAVQEALHAGSIQMKGDDARIMMMNQLVQVRSELECQALSLEQHQQQNLSGNNKTTVGSGSNIGAPPSSSKNSSGSNNNSSSASIESLASDTLAETRNSESVSSLIRQLRRVAREISDYVKKNGGLSRAQHQSTKAVYSSFSHLDSSKTLFKLGIVHENEKMLANGYQVDIFIPKYQKNYDQTIENIVVEFDGPTHFDSYLTNPLGPTAMKKRHLRQLGYKVVTMRHLDYSLSATAEEKCRIIRAALDRLAV